MRTRPEQEPGDERIAIDGRIDCRDADGRHWLVLRWSRQLKRNVAGEGLRWVSVGPAVFTLGDASAVIQVGGSQLQVVASGRVLTVADPDDRPAADTAPRPWSRWTSRLLAAPAAWFHHG
jgi:hypothetical protein